MRKLLTLFFVALTVCAAARQLTPEEAAAVATEFLNTHSPSRQAAKRVAVTPVKAKQVSDTDALRPFYVFNAAEDRGFVIVSGDDRAHKILGYSTAGRFDFDNLPPACEELLKQYEKEMEALSSMPSKAAESDNTISVSRPAIEPMITTKWGQWAPYNLECPVVSDITAPTGCVATAFAQVMNYHKWPERGAGSHAYEYGGNSYSIDFSDIEFDWDAMLDEYDNESSQRNQDAVSILMKACGYSVDMMYGVNASGAYTSNIIEAAHEYFDYSGQAFYANREDFTLDQWEAIIYSQLSKGLPIIYAGRSEYGGHCFVCDGYDGVGFYHFNWGWNGWDDGYFLLTGAPEALNGFIYDQGCIVNFYPSNKENIALSDGVFLYQTLDDGKVALIGLSDPNHKLGGEVVLPDEAVIGGVTYSVTTLLCSICDIIDLDNIVRAEIRLPMSSIPDEAFAYADKLEAIILPPTLLSIGRDAFRECKSLAGPLVIPSSTTSIGECAFLGCSGITGSLELPSSIIEIGYAAFMNCSGFTGSLELPSSIESIEMGAFSDCSGFTGSLELPSSIESIGIGAFSGCSGFTGSLNLPSSITEIGHNAFMHCSGFTGSLELPSSIESIGDGAFFGCSGFTGSLELPSSIKSIGVITFFGCSGFTGSLNLPSSVTEIGDEAFLGCSGFTGSLELPSSIESIGKGAFYGCSGFTGSLELPSSIKYIGATTFSGCSGFTGTLTIPESVTYIGEWAFASCSGFTGSLDIPDSVTQIGTQAFMRCSGFDGSLMLPNSLTSIPQQCFYGCSGLTGSLKIPDSVTSIGVDAFYGCSGFDGTLTIPESVTYIGDWAFDNCSGLSGSLELPNSVTYIGHKAFNNCSGFTGSLIIPNSVESIEKETFSGCSGFDGTLTIPESVTYIGERAFDNCSGFTGSLDIPDSVTQIGAHAFMRCSGFDGSLTLPNSLTSIPQQCFYGCSGFAGSLKIPDSVTSIEVDAFFDCSGFTGSLEIPNSVINIGEAAFCWCSGFTGSLEIPNSISTIENAVFSQCSGFTGTLTIPNSVTAIKSMAFLNCNGFEGTITIPESVIEIGDYAFYCDGNRNFNMMSATPPAIGHPFENACIGVPTGSGAIYRADENWALYDEIYEFGDANTDRRLNVADVAAVINDVVGKDNCSFNEFIADINFDDLVSADDATRIVDAILDYNSDASTLSASRNSGTLVSDNFRLDSDSNAIVEVRLSGAPDAVAFQCDLIAGEGLKIGDIEPEVAIGETHMMKVQSLGDSRMRVVVYSFENKMMETEGSLLTVHLHGDSPDVKGALRGENIFLATPDGADIELSYTGGENLNLSNITGVMEQKISVAVINGTVAIMNAKGMHIEIYNADGRLADSFVAASSAEYRNLPAGIYIIKTASSATKVVI